MKRTTWTPDRAADLVAATGYDDAFDDCAPTQPIAVGRHQVGLLRDDQPARAADAVYRHTSSAHRRPSPSQRCTSAVTGDVIYREPAWTAGRPARPTISIAVAVATAVIIGALGYQSWAALERSAPATNPTTEARQTGDLPPGPPPPSADVRSGDRSGALSEADGVVPDGVTVYDDVPAVSKLDPAIFAALRRAATDAADDGVTFVVNSGWRSRAYQNTLLREAVSTYGSQAEAARWVATPDTSPHVSGHAVDIGDAVATTWLSKHGAAYGLCRIYRNEPWHYELRSNVGHDGCPPLYADPTHDPRMQK